MQIGFVRFMVIKTSYLIWLSIAHVNPSAVVVVTQAAAAGRMAVDAITSVRADLRAHPRRDAMATMRCLNALIRNAGTRNRLSNETLLRRT